MIKSVLWKKEFLHPTDPAAAPPCLDRLQSDTLVLQVRAVTLSESGFNCSEKSGCYLTARKLPRAHNFALVKVNHRDREKIDPTDISCDELHAANTMAQLNLARKCTCKYDPTLAEHLEC